MEGGGGGLYGCHLDLQIEGGVARPLQRPSGASAPTAAAMLRRPDPGHCVHVRACVRAYVHVCVCARARMCMYTLYPSSIPLLYTALLHTRPVYPSCIPLLYIHPAYLHVQRPSHVHAHQRQSTSLNEAQLHPDPAPIHPQLDLHPECTRQYAPPVHCSCTPLLYIPPVHPPVKPACIPLMHPSCTLPTFLH
jgi:hypothetical protein